MQDIPVFAGAANGSRPASNTVVENGAWIGTEAVIVPDVTIGNEAVIGTRAEVARDV